VFARGEAEATGNYGHPVTNCTRSPRLGGVDARECNELAVDCIHPLFELDDAILVGVSQLAC